MQVIKQLEAVARASSSSGVVLVNLFVDKPYNRTSFTLVSQQTKALADAAVRVASTALQALDLRQHEATHPRLGTVDHVSCHPMERSGPMTGAAQVARHVGEALADQCGLPVFFYGAAHPQGARLADIRRAAGYFEGSARGAWSGAITSSGGGGSSNRAGSSNIGGSSNGGGAPSSLLPPFSPDLGPTTPPPRSGVACVGAVPWLVNYNVLLDTADLAAGRQIARCVSERGGGLREVQAMALEHEQGVEVACNILDDEVSSPEAVLARTTSLAAERGVAVRGAYRISRSPEQLVQEAQRALEAAAAAEREAGSTV